MSILKKYFPLSFTEKNDVISLLISIAVYFVAGLILDLVLGFAASIPLIGIIFGIAAWLIGIYCFVGIVLCVLDYFKLLK